MAKIIGGTTLVKDIRPGADSSYPDVVTNINGILYFSAQDEEYNEDLWKINGNTGAIFKIKDIYPYDDSSWIDNPINVNNTFYFVGVGVSDYPEYDEYDVDIVTTGLWKSDGTQAGTIPLVEYGWYNAGYTMCFIYDIIDVNGKVFYLFELEDEWSDYTNELWTSDGTVEGTKMIMSIDSYQSSLANLRYVGETIYFTIEDHYDGGTELWKSDGTEKGTVLVKNIYPTQKYNSAENLTDFNGVLYFTIDDNVNGGYDLWKSDGTTAGTVLVKDIHSGASDHDYEIENFININGTMFFTIDDSENGGIELWKSNGTAAGTFFIKEFNSGEYLDSLENFTNVNGTLFFTIYDALEYYEDYEGYHCELWKSNGTAAGTVLVKKFESFDIDDDYWYDEDQEINNLTNVNGTLYFRGWDSVYGNELWKSDGTTAGTVISIDINPGEDSSEISNMTNINGTLYFQANDGSHGYELWKSDGTLNEKYIGDAQDNSYRADVGNDTLMGKGGNDTLYGDEGADLIKGDNSDDILDGGLNKDTLEGGFGDDVVQGKDGSDRLNGNAGYDALSGGSGDDVILGGNDFDILKGEKGNDSLKGDAGNDLLRGGLGLDNISGGTGNDTLMGDEGNDVIKGDGGQDLIVGALPTGVKPGAGEIDTLTGGGAKDTFVLGNNNGAFYRTSGIKDYALIKDFSKTDSDRIQLAGTASDYQLANAKDYLSISGKAIVLKATDQLIGVIQGQTNNLNLTSKYFTYQAAGSSNSLSNLDLNAILADFDNPYLDQVDLML